MTELRKTFAPPVRAVGPALPEQLGGARGGLWAAFLAVCAAGGTALQAQEPRRATASDEKLLLVPIREPITKGSADRLRNEIASYIEDDLTYQTVVFRFDGGGGDPAACRGFAEYVQGLGERTTVAWLDLIEEPLGAQIIVVLAAKEIVLGREAVLSALPEQAGVTRKEPAFDRDYQRDLDRYAHRRNRPTPLLRALIDRNHDDILRVLFRGEPGAPENRGRWPAPGNKEVAFMVRGEFQKLPNHVRTLDAEKEEVICARGKALRMNARQAREWKFTDLESASTVPDLLLSLGLDIPPSNVVDLRHGSLQPSSPSGQAVIDFLNSPIVRVLLIVGGCLGLLLELKMPGTIIPGVLGVASFLLLFISSLFPVSGTPVGTATVFEILLFFIGLGLLAVEFLVLPGVAVFALAGGAICLISLILIMVPPPSASMASQMTVKDAIWTLIFGFGTGAFAFALFLKALPRWTAVSHGGLVSHSSIQGVPNAESALESQMRLSDLIGQRGVVETTLRPAGKVLLDDGRSLDVVAEGDYVERGDRVVVTGATSTRVIVAREEPSEGHRPA